MNEESPMTKMTDHEIQIVNLYGRQKAMRERAGKEYGFREEQAAMAMIGRRYLDDIADRHPEEWAVMFPADA